MKKTLVILFFTLIGTYNLAVGQNTIPVNIPNVFTPNYDNVNDTWSVTIGNLPEDITYTSYSLTIFNRWGIKVFESEQPRRKWDGHDTSGLECEAGTFYFVIKTEYSSAGISESLDTKGTIQLCR